MSGTLLAGDVGGTKTSLGLFHPDYPRPTPIVMKRYATAAFDSLESVVARFLRETPSSAPVTAACFGVAGPVRNGVSQLTNVPWVVDARLLGVQVGIKTVGLLNDLEAMVTAVPTLRPAELSVVRTGSPEEMGNLALIAPGTGLGEAGLRRVDGRLVPAPSEGGHTDFAARTPRELELVAWLLTRTDRVALEDVVSGPGLLTLFQFTHQVTRCGASQDAEMSSPSPATITSNALDDGCPACLDALDLFVSALGAAAGNLALRTLSTAGVFVGGGIAPHLGPALHTGGFTDAFVNKGPMRSLLDPIPVWVVLHEETALLGAAIAANTLAHDSRA
ncbi:MAG: glucokinase [Acidobacteriota bacterium]|nr:glucokinase [Acidobacteriota bacterium]